MGKLIKVFQDLGISVIDNNGMYRSLKDIIEELNNIWNKLTERQKYHICVIILGGELVDEK